jgi:hypothetical protein
MAVRRVVRDPTPQDRARDLQRMTYADYLRTPEWETLKVRALTDAAHRCRGCDISGDLEVHHRRYPKPFEWGSELSDLVVLCHPCHRAVHVVRDLRHDITRGVSC